MYVLAFLHTGDLESVNALLLLYMPKRIAYRLVNMEFDDLSLPFLLVSPHLGSGRFWLLWTTIIILTGIPPNFLAFKYSILLTREQATTKAGKAQWKLKVLSKWFILSPFLFQSSRNGKDCSLKIVRKAKNAM